MAAEKGANIPPIKVYPDKYEGQVVVITGAAQGIGETTVRLFAEQGATVVLLDIIEEKLSSVLSDIEQKGGKGGYYVCDVSDEKRCIQVVDEIISKFKKIDVLVQLAAVLLPQLFPELPTERFKKVLDINVNGLFYLTKAVLPHMQKAGYGRLINTSSASFEAPEIGLNAYMTSKGAIVGFTRQIAAEAGPGITANIVMPGLIETQTAWDTMYTPGGPNPFDRFVGRQFVKRSGQPIDIAHTISFIASPEAQFTTAQVFDCGGGYTIN